MGRPVEGNSDPLACATALEYYAVSPAFNSCLLCSNPIMTIVVGFGAQYLRTYLPAQPGPPQHDPQAAIRCLRGYCE